MCLSSSWDKSSRFFHSLVKRNAKRNFIASIKDDVTSASSMKEIQEELLGYYINLLGSRQGFMDLMLGYGFGTEGVIYTS